MPSPTAYVSTTLQHVHEPVIQLASAGQIVCVDETGLWYPPVHGLWRPSDHTQSSTAALSSITTPGRALFKSLRMTPAKKACMDTE